MDSIIMAELLNIFFVQITFINLFIILTFILSKIMGACTSCTKDKK
jgi:hypothetical protein